jgi:hypothetical protein
MDFLVLKKKELLSEESLLDSEVAFRLAAGSFSRE